MNFQRVGQKLLTIEDFAFNGFFVSERNRPEKPHLPKEYRKDV